MKMHCLFLAASVSLFIAGGAAAQERVVKGKVIDSVTKQPVPEAGVSVPGTNLTAITDQDGNFTLPAPVAGEVTLRIEGPTGYASTQVVLAAGADDARISLNPTSLATEEIVVIGRATGVRKSQAGISVAKVKSEDLIPVTAQTVDEAIEGKVVGANIQRNDGAPGGGVQVRLRGVSTINAESQPLYVVDGLIVSNVEIPSGLSFITKSTQGSNPSPKQDSVVNRVADLNPNDIENIDVLKGASAAAIYGSKASNGVIIITTKRGQPGPPRFDITQRVGVYVLQKELGKRVFTNQADVQDAFGPTGVALWRPGVIYNHDAELASQRSPSTETILSASGSTGGTQYFLSGTQRTDVGIIPNTGYEKQSLRVNLGRDFTTDWRVNLNTNLIHSITRRGVVNNDNSNASYYAVLPFTPNFIDLKAGPNGIFPPNPFISNLSNPLQTAALSKTDEGVWRFIVSGDTSYRLFGNETHQLSLLANAGADRFQQEDQLFFPPALYFEQTDPLPGASLFTNGTNLNLNGGVNLLHNYSPASSWFSATTSTGFQYESRELNIVRVLARNLTAGQQNVDAGTQIQTSQRREKVIDRGVYLQSDLLALEQRLALSGGLRGELSSANGDPNKVYLYPKVSAALRFFDPVPQVDLVKFRAAYGETGNQPLYGMRFTELATNANIDGNPALNVTGVLGNPNIKPERQHEVEAGFDLTLLGARANLEFTVYQRQISDLILLRAVAPSTGFTNEFFNGGVLRNRGIEIALDSTPFASSLVNWQSRVSFAKNVSKITSLPVPAFTTGGFGTSLGAFRIEQGASATQIVGNDGLKPDGTCCIVHQIGDAEPNFRMSFINRVSSHGFTLYVLLDWQNGSNILNLTRFFYDLAKNSPDYTTGGIARLNTFTNSARAYLESATFVKLREVNLSYDFPASATTGLWSAMRSVRLSVSARNLLTFTPYSSFDPEVSNFGNQPIFRNIEVAPYPASRSFWTSIDVGFQ
jgi:TonB-linked SusC/RagA family outer membrane protein